MRGAPWGWLTSAGYARSSENACSSPSTATARRPRGTCGRSCGCSSSCSRCTSGWSPRTASSSGRSESPCGRSAQAFAQRPPEAGQRAHRAPGSSLHFSGPLAPGPDTSACESRERQRLSQAPPRFLPSTPLPARAWPQHGLRASRLCLSLVGHRSSRAPGLRPAAAEGTPACSCPPCSPQAAAPGRGAARPGVGALPEPAAHPRPPARAGAGLRRGGDAGAGPRAGEGQVRGAVPL